ncbi:hypothetical protein K449DRAFT_434339 [Hypoxylon sp. EC38]|nr:hypothetical protein K449DRAFT_434339 [Hypoxylon sp. EC38]
MSQDFPRSSYGAGNRVGNNPGGCIEAGTRRLKAYDSGLMVGREQWYIPDQHHVVLKDVEVIIHSRAGPRAEKWTIVKSERGLGWESPDVVGVLQRQSKAKFCNMIGSFGSDDLDETIRPLIE